MKILDLGCGTAKVKGAIGADIALLDGVDVLTNLSDLPFPFAENSFDEIHLNDVIEHLPDTIATMEEIHRIARPDAKVYIRVVNWNSHYTAMDPTHLHAFTEKSFDFFGKIPGRSYYSRARYDVVKIGYQYNALAEKLLRYRPLMKFFSFFLNNILEGLSFELKTLKVQPEPPEEWKDLFSVLRCPCCLAENICGGGNDLGQLKNIENKWLVCQEQGCGRKYPVIDGSPIMSLAEGGRYMSLQETELPAPPVERFPRIKVDPAPSDVDFSKLYRCERYEDLGLGDYLALVKRGIRFVRKFLVACAGATAVILFVWWLLHMFGGL